MSRTFDCTDDTQREEGLRTAATAIGRGGLVVMPTDTVYGVAADAFNPGAVNALLTAKGRDRSMPPPVLIAGKDVLAALAAHPSDEITALAEAFWPGGLTIICWAQPSLAWDLGDTGGTVAIRVPDHPVALALLRTCGPLAVSSANLSGRPAAGTAAQAEQQLGDGVQVYLESGRLAGSMPSTIVDATGDVPVVVRAGAIGLAELQEAVPSVRLPGDASDAYSDDAEQADGAPEPGSPAGQDYPGAGGPTDEVAAAAVASSRVDVVDDSTAPGVGDLRDDDEPFSSARLGLEELDFTPDTAEFEEPDFSRASAALEEQDFSSASAGLEEGADAARSDRARGPATYDARAAFTARSAPGQGPPDEPGDETYDARAAFSRRGGDGETPGG
ncbi:MAG: L-threonylcarbamoyladenylate synthase [Actinomycetales bacterium]